MAGAKGSGVRFVRGEFGRLNDLVSQAGIGAELVFTGSQTPHRRSDGVLVRSLDDLPAGLSVTTTSGMVLADIPENRIRAQTRCALDNLAAVLESAGSSLDRILHLRLFLRDVRDMGSAAGVVFSVLGSDTPATTIVEATGNGVDVEIDVQIDAVAALKESSFNPVHVKVSEVEALVRPFPAATCFGPMVFTTPVSGINLETGKLTSSLNELTEEERALADPSYVNPRDEAVVAEHLVMWRNLKRIMAATDVPFNGIVHQNNWMGVSMQQLAPVARVRRNIFGQGAARTATTSLPVSGLRTPRAAYECSIIGVRSDAVNIGYAKEIKLGGHGVASYYVGAVRTGPYVFAAGEVPVRHSDGKARIIANVENAQDGIRFLQYGRIHREIPLMTQADTVYSLIAEALAGYGCGFEHVVHQAVYLVDPIEFTAVERVATLRYGPTLPPTTLIPIQGASPYRSSLLEIEVTAISPAR